MCSEVSSKNVIAIKNMYDKQFFFLFQEEKFFLFQIFSTPTRIFIFSGKVHAINSTNLCTILSNVSCLHMVGGLVENFSFFFKL